VGTLDTIIRKQVDRYVWVDRDTVVTTSIFGVQVDKDIVGGTTTVVIY
jgi:hypothetical protein